MQKPSIKFSEYPLFSGKLGDFPSGPTLLINTINQYSYCIAENDLNFRTALLASDVLLPDGIAIVVAINFLTGKKIKKIAGADLHQFFLEDLDKKSGSCFYLGASDRTLKKIKDKLAEHYPNISVGTFSPPHKPVFTKEENKQMIDEVNSFKPDVVFVGMTAPKQEKWAFEHRNELHTKAICTIGAVFDFYAGTVHRPSKFWINMGLEWLIRLVNEPKRLWKRYLYYGPVFIYQVIKQKVISK